MKIADSLLKKSSATQCIAGTILILVVAILLGLIDTKTQGTVSIIIL